MSLIPNKKERYSARHKAAYAIKTGKLKRLPCEVCGNPDSRIHHPSYRKPLEVVFLCKVHHEKVHREQISPLAGM